MDSKKSVNNNRELSLSQLVIIVDFDAFEIKAKHAYILCSF